MSAHEERTARGPLPPPLPPPAAAVTASAPAPALAASSDASTAPALAAAPGPAPAASPAHLPGTAPLSDVGHLQPSPPSPAVDVSPGAGVAAAERPAGRAPSLAAVTWSRFVVDLKVFVRNGQSVGFTLMFPVMMLFLFASIFSGTVEGTGVTVSQLYVAGLIGSSAIATGFVNTAIGVAFERERGELKRLAGTPMPKAAFFLGRGGSVLVMTAAQVLVLLVIGMVFYDLSLPTRPTAWLTFAGVLVLGTLGSTLLGLAVGGRIGNAKAAPAVVNLPFVFLQFISGVFIPFTDLPEGLRTVSGFFPLRWLAQGMRSVFLPESFARQEPSGSWQHPLMWIVLGVWAVVGLAVCVRWFRWVEEERGR